MKTLFRRFLAFVLSLAVIFAPTYSFAASGWSIKNTVTSGIETTIVATKDGASAALKVAPSAARVGGLLMRGANLASMAYAIAQLLGDGIDWTMDSDAQAIRYKEVTTGRYFILAGNPSISGTTQREVADKGCAAMGFGPFTRFRDADLDIFYCQRGPGSYSIQAVNGTIEIPKTLPISQVVSKVIQNAKSGHAESQAVVKAAAVEMVVNGAADTWLEQGAVPNDRATDIDDFDFKNGQVVSGGSSYDEGVDGVTVGRPVAGAVPTGPADDAQRAADDARNNEKAASDARDSAKDNQTKAHDAANDLVNANTEELINQLKGIKDAAQAAAQAASDAAQAAAQGARAAAEAAKAAADKAIADAQNVSAAQAAAAAREVARAKAAAADAEARAQAAEKAAAEAKKAADEAKKDKPKAPDGTGWPSFCQWAKPVCDAVEWLQKPIPDEVTEIDTGEDADPAPSSTDINFGGSCPSDFSFHGSIFGNAIDITLLKTSMLCDFLSTYVKWPVYAVSSLFAIYIIGGRKDG